MIFTHVTGKEKKVASVVREDTVHNNLL